MNMPKLCETCGLFKPESHKVNDSEYDGYCMRYPEWINVKLHHICGEYIVPESTKA